MISYIRKCYTALKDRLVEPEMATHFEGRRTANVPIVFDLRAEQVRQQCEETVTWDAPIDEHGNIIVGDYSELREPMDGVVTTAHILTDAHGVPLPGHISAEAVDRAYARALSDPGAALGPTTYEEKK